MMYDTVIRMNISVTITNSFCIGVNLQLQRTLYKIQALSDHIRSNVLNEAPMIVCFVCFHYVNIVSKSFISISPIYRHHHFTLLYVHMCLVFFLSSIDMDDKEKDTLHKWIKMRLNIICVCDDARFRYL